MTRTYPVSEPLLVVVRAGRLDSLDGEVSGKSPADQVGHGRGEAEHVEEDEDDGTALSAYISTRNWSHDSRDGKTENAVCLGNLRSGFNVTEDGVFVELRYKLRNGKSKIACEWS